MLHQGVEARMVVQGIQIGVTHDPFFVAESVVDSLLQAGHRIFRFSQQGVCACDIVQHSAVFGFHIERALSPFEASFAVADFAKRGSAKVNGARVVGMELEVLFDPSQRLLLCCASFLGIVQGSTAHSYVDERLIVVGIDFGRFFEQADGFFMISLSKVGPAIKVMSFEELGIQTDRLFKFPLRFFMIVAERNGQTTRSVSFCGFRIQLGCAPTGRVCLAQVVLAGVEIHEKK